MGKKSISKLTFSEEYINKMLNDGWRLIEFKVTSKAVFEECPRNKYICKKVLVDLQFEEDSREIKNKLEEIVKLGQAEVIPLQYENSPILINYIIYDKETIISDEILKHNIPVSNGQKYITKGISKSLLKIFLPLVYTSGYIFIWTVWLIEADSLIIKIIWGIFIVSMGHFGISNIFNRTRGLILTVYNRYLITKK